MSVENKAILTNAGGGAAYFSIPISLFNPTGASVVVPASHLTQISFAFE